MSKRRTMFVTRTFARPVSNIWAVARGFCHPWHPALATMVAEDKGRIRRFTVKGEDTVYREQLTYFSDSDRTLSYLHLQGIAGAAHYAATFTIAPAEQGCVVTWSAEIAADEPRATQIAEGTRQVFEMGLDALETATPSPSIANTLRFSNDTLCLFLHGIGGNSSNWAKQVPIAAQFMKAEALDLRGYGDAPLGPLPTTIDDYCNDILEVMQSHGAKRLVLCGLSYGSWIATSFAMRYPEKLSGLILSGGCTGMSEAPVEEREAFRKARKIPLNQGQTPRDFAPAVVDVIASPNATTEMRAELFNSMAAIPAETYRDALSCFTNPTEKFDFSKLTMPVLFVTGEHDRLASPTEIRTVARRVHQSALHPCVRFEVIAHAGHVCNLEQPEAYNALLSESLSGLK